MRLPLAEVKLAHGSNLHTRYDIHLMIATVTISGLTSKQLGLKNTYIVVGIRKHIRLIAGIIALLIGIAFFIVPVIPVLGVAGLFAGAFLLAPYIPILNKFKEWLKKKDSSGKTKKTEEKMQELEEKYGENSGTEEKHQQQRFKKQE